MKQSTKKSIDEAIVSLFGIKQRMFIFPAVLMPCMSMNFNTKHKLEVCFKINAHAHSKLAPRQYFLYIKIRKKIKNTNYDCKARQLSLWRHKKVRTWGP